MGSLGGHVIPGAFFVFYGLVWITMSFWLYLTTPSKSPSNPKGKGGSTTTTYLGYKREVRLGRLSYIPQSFLPKVPMEPIIKIFLSSLGIIVEAFFVENNGKVRFSVVKLYLPDGSFGGVSKIHHITMYGSFLLSGIVDLVGLTVHLPKNFTKMFFSITFVIEGILFWYHTHDKDALNVTVHSLLICAIFFCVIFSVLRMFQPANVMINSFLGVAILLQGTWFIQVGTILYGKHSWNMENDKEMGKNLMMATAAFTWHIIGNALGTVLMYVFLLACIRGSAKYRSNRKQKRSGSGFTWPTLPLVNNEVKDLEEREQLMRENNETKDTLL